MFIPKTFAVKDQADIAAFIHANSFGILVSVHEGLPWATHIPLVYEPEKNRLTGHIARANAQGKSFENQEVLAIFNGPHAYISSSWYEKENVPTWNYKAVHVYGILKKLSLEELYEAMDQMVNKYESGNPKPVKMKNLSEKTLRQMKGVIGFSIEITKIEAVAKLSQNRNDTDYDAIIDQLESQDVQAQAVAAEMRRNKQK